jgi:hypothetical protein
MRAIRIMIAAAVAIGASALLTGTAIAGEAAAGASVAGAKASKTDTSKRVCRSIMPTGSRLGARQCRTQAEWDERARLIQHELQRQQLENSSRQDPRVGGSPM